MRPGLFILPFISLLLVSLGSAIGSSMPEFAFADKVGFGVGVAIMFLWLALDWQGFKDFFSRKGTKYGASSGVIVVLGLAIIVGLAMLSTRDRFNLSYDLTRSGSNTLSDQSIKIIEKLKTFRAPIQITGFFKDEEVENSFRDLLQLYKKEGASIEVEFINPQSSPSRALAAQIQNDSSNTAIFKSPEGKGDSVEFRINAFTEEKFTNAIVHVLKKETKKIYFTQGHGEPSLKANDPEGYDAIVEELEKNKYQVAALSILEEGSIPEDTHLLVIPGPKYDLKEEEGKLISEYLLKGGALLVMVDALTPVKAVNELLKPFGLGFNEDFLVLNPNDMRVLLYGSQNNAIINDFDAFHPVTKDFARQSSLDVLMSFTRTTFDTTESYEEAYKYMNVTAVAKASDSIIRLKDVSQESDLETITEEQTESGSFPVMMVSSGKVQSDLTSDESETENQKRNIRIVAIGSSQFARNKLTQFKAENKDIFMNAANYLLEDEDYISIRPKPIEQSELSLSTTSSQLWLLFISYLYPCLFIGGGVFYWLLRRRA